MIQANPSNQTMAILSNIRWRTAYISYYLYIAQNYCSKLKVFGKIKEINGFLSKCLTQHASNGSMHHKGFYWKQMALTVIHKSPNRISLRK